MSKLHCLGLILWACYSSVGASEGIERVDPPQDITDFSLTGIDGKQHRSRISEESTCWSTHGLSGVHPVVLKCPRYNAPTKN